MQKDRNFLGQSIWPDNRKGFLQILGAYCCPTHSVYIYHQWTLGMLASVH